jgi:putative transposase
MKESHSIKSLCEVFEIHRSSYRYWKVNTNKIRSDDVYTDSKVKVAYALSGGSAGSKTIATIVTSDGYDLSRYSASTSLKRQELFSCQPPKHMLG